MGGATFIEPREKEPCHPHFPTFHWRPLIRSSD